MWHSQSFWILKWAPIWNHLHRKRHSPALCEDKSEKVKIFFFWQQFLSLLSSSSLTNLKWFLSLARHCCRTVVNKHMSLWSVSHRPSSSVTREHLSASAYLCMWAVALKRNKDMLKHFKVACLSDGDRLDCFLVFIFKCHYSYLYKYIL